MVGKDELEKIVVKVDPDLQDIVGGYLANRRREIETIEECLLNVDFEAMRVIGHIMKGSGGGYGFERITELGAAIEQGAKEKDPVALAARMEELSDYLDRLEIVFG